ncbi:MAG: hypothetical protein QOE70_205 [Chthoniobacter sp.]|jgi:hypothetical protein|nr:hypothetical protein [Chthoniobacter sp.]
MTFTTEAEQILKSDARGRVRVPIERQEALLDEFERSGLSGVKFAKLVGVKYPTFAAWAQRRRRARAGAAAAEGGKEAAQSLGSLSRVGGSIRLFEAVAAKPAAADRAGRAMIVELPGGGRLLVQAADQLRWAAELLRLLSQAEARPC